MPRGPKPKSFVAPPPPPARLEGVPGGVVVDRTVYNGIQRVRESGLTNMFDVNRVLSLLIQMGEMDAAEWVSTNRDDYAAAVFRGLAYPAPVGEDRGYHRDRR